MSDEAISLGYVYVMLYVLLVQVVLALTIYQIFYCPTRSGPYSIGQEAYVVTQVLISHANSDLSYLLR